MTLIEKNSLCVLYFIYFYFQSVWKVNVLHCIKEVIDWLIDSLLFYVALDQFIELLFYVLKNFSLIWRKSPLPSEGLQNLGLCSALRVFEQGGIFIMPHLLWHGVSVFLVSSYEPPLNRLLRHTRGCGESILTRILTGSLHLKLLHSWRRHICWWRALSSALWVYELGESLSCHSCCDTWPRIFFVSSEGPPPFSRLLWHTRGCGGSTLTRILATFTHIDLYITIHQYCMMKGMENYM
jgi:hypothetical protein